MKASKSGLPLGWQRKDFDTLCAVPSCPSPDLGRAEANRSLLEIQISISVKGSDLQSGNPELPVSSAPAI